MGKKLCFDTKSFKRPQSLIKLELTALTIFKLAPKRD
jgi:hypothetical protein